MSDGYKALRESAALLDLNKRGRIALRGEDCARLLHAMTTNHIQQLTPGTGCYAFFLNAQGRILSDANILCLADSFLLDLEGEAHDTLYQHLDKFIIADDVTPEDARSSWSVFGVEGPSSEAALHAASLPTPSVPFATELFATGLVARISMTGMPGFRVFTSDSSLVESLGAVPANEHDIRTVRLENHKPRYTEDITDRYLVQETQMFNAVHFSKGCYLGQEIVERVRSRGLVHRVLVPLRIKAAEAVDKGTILRSGEDKAGEITSSAYSPALNAVVAMGYIKRDFAKAGVALTAGESTAEVLAAGPLTDAR